MNIPKIEIGPLPFINNYKTRLSSQYFNIIEQEERGRLVMEALNQDPRVLNLDGKLTSIGNSGASFQVYTLAMWFLWYEDQHGQDKAKTCLEAYLNSETISVINTLWVVGIEVENPIVLDGGYLIRPLESMPDSADKEYFLRINNMGKNRMGQVPAPICAITKDCTIKKIKIGKWHDIDEEYSEISARLKDIALILNAINGVFCLPYSYTSYVNPEVPFGPFEGNDATSLFYDVSPRAFTKLSESKVHNINELIKMYWKLVDKDKEGMRGTLDRLSKAKNGTKIENQILDLGIALEMLLLKNSNKEQISLSFRLRGSWLLGADKEDRFKKYEQLNKIYGYRSDLAHNGMLTPKKIQKVSESFSEYLIIAENICQKIIKDGYPKDWNKLILDVI
jgi:hypothetical protein